MPIAFFATKSSQADYLASMLWEIVEAVVTCGFHVLAVIADGASCNRKLFHLLNNEKLHVPYKCINIYDPDVPLFLISDPPHLLKTACNNIRSSSVHGSKLLKYDEHFILWEHFKKVPTLFDTTELRCCKLTAAHFSHQSYAKMKVSYAAHLLSNSVAQLMSKRGGKEMKKGPGSPNLWTRGLIWWILVCLILTTKIYVHSRGWMIGVWRGLKSISLLNWKNGETIQSHHIDRNSF